MQLGSAPSVTADTHTHTHTQSIRITHTDLQFPAAVESGSL